MSSSTIKMLMIGLLVRGPELHGACRRHDARAAPLFTRDRGERRRLACQRGTRLPHADCQFRTPPRAPPARPRANRLARPLQLPAEVTRTQKGAAMSKQSILKSLALFTFIAVGGAGTSSAAEPHRHRPPQEAFDACAKKAEGAACEVTFREHTMTGTCAATPEGGALACRPNHPPGPPPELKQACEGKNDGDACTASHHGQSEEGVCRRGRSGTLICLP
jgi:hypothetical protein